MRNSIVGSLVICLVVLAAAAGAEQERSYEQLSPNGRYLFVMLAKGADAGGVVDTLTKRYGHSGLYKASGPRKPLWRVNWYSPKVHVSSDGIHLVRIGRSNVSTVSGKPDVSQTAISFYKRGDRIKKYTVGDLIKDPSGLTKSGNSYQWQKRIAFDDASGKLRVTLVTGKELAFDTKTGLQPAKKTRPKSKKQGG